MKPSQLLRRNTEARYKYNRINECSQDNVETTLSIDFALTPSNQFLDGFHSILIDN